MTVYLPTTAPDAQSPSVLTGSTSPAPAIGSSYFYIASNELGYQRKDLNSQANWSFRRLVYLGAPSSADLDLVAFRLGADASNALLVRSQSTGYLRMVANGGAFAWTSTALVPTAGWYRLEGYGNAVNGIARVALFTVAGTTPLTGLDSDSIACAQGGVGATGVRYGRTSGSGSNYTAKLAWALDEFRTGADAPQSFIGPWTSTSTPTATYTLTSPQRVGQQMTLVFTPSGFPAGNVAWSVNWDGTVTTATLPSTSTYTVTHTDTNTNPKQIQYTADPA